MRRLADTISRRPRRTLAVALVLTAVAGGLGAGASKVLAPYNGDPDPSAESARAAKQLEGATGVDPRGVIVAVVDTGLAARSRAGRGRIDAVAVRLRGDPA